MGAGRRPLPVVPRVGRVPWAEGLGGACCALGTRPGTVQSAPLTWMEPRSEGGGRWSLLCMKGSSCEGQGLVPGCQQGSRGQSLPGHLAGLFRRCLWLLEK